MKENMNNSIVLKHRVLSMEWLKVWPKEVGRTHYHVYHVDIKDGIIQWTVGSKIQEGAKQEGKTHPIWELVPLGGRRIQEKGIRVWIWWKYQVLVYENGKMRYAETIPGMGEGRDKEECWRGWIQL
jgi:hypothetical protein